METAIIKVQWTWHNTNQNLYGKAKNITKKNTTMAFCKEKKQVYLKIDVSGVGLGASLPQVRNGMWFPRNDAPNNAVLQPVAFTSKILTNPETYYNSIEREVLSILQGLEKFHNYCFTHEATDHW